VACLSAGAAAAGAGHSTNNDCATAGSTSRNRCGQGVVPPAAAAAAAAGPCLAVSCSYDKTVKVWEVGPDKAARSRGGRTTAAAAAARQVAVLTGHDSPVLELAVQPAAAGCTTGSSSNSPVFLTGEVDSQL